MNKSELSLTRPVLVIVMNIIVIFGAIGFSFLAIRDYPAIDPPNISVRTSYSGENAEIIESQITKPLEKSINGIIGGVIFSLIVTLFVIPAMYSYLSRKKRAQADTAILLQPRKVVVEV